MAMFLLRRRPHYRTVRSHQMMEAVDVEHFSELMLTTLFLLGNCAPRARRLLACTDLPQGTNNPTLILSPDERARLQYDCLHRILQDTQLRKNVTLLHMAVKRCIADGTVYPLLAEYSLSGNIYWMSDEMTKTAAMPGSPLHLAWHEFDRLPLTRSQSYSDLHNYATCLCLPATDDEKDMMESITAEVKALRLDMMNRRPEDDDDVEDDTYYL